MESHVVSEVQVFPYYAGITADVAPVAVGEGVFFYDQIMNNQYLRLRLQRYKELSEMHIGATYSWAGSLIDGSKTSSHWMYCTSIGPAPTFGASINWSRGGVAAPLLEDVDGVPVKLEPLDDIHAILKSPNPIYGHSQAQLGERGWLVMVTATSPVCIGVLIEDQTVPAYFTQGARDITIVAKSKRTLQSVLLDGLYCAKLDETALFLKPAE
ncbi:hypothetical protein [uncultured Tateyamaria sp.]|uniref:hypothetical protein n=1 Tax=uncultured Tateyamaria sp. TaxID=455651 RepID=UPI002609D22E|nr:hypothetical protein [uncultured Tateyamaria sp.]